MDKVRIGIIGLGGMGSSHATYLSQGQIAGAELAAVADIDPARLADVQDKYGAGVQAFAEADALFAAQCVDAVIVATPHYFHPPLVIQALENGLHAMSEKPAGVYTRQVREMNEAAAKSDRVFGMMFNQRARGEHQKLKSLVESGELGPIQRTIYIINNWFRAQSYYDSGGWRATWAGEGGGVLANQCPHNLDLWQWICGMPQRVRAFCRFGQYHDIEVEDGRNGLRRIREWCYGCFYHLYGRGSGDQSAGDFSGSRQGGVGRRQNHLLAHDGVGEQVPRGVAAWVWQPGGLEVRDPGRWWRGAQGDYPKLGASHPHGVAAVGCGDRGDQWRGVVQCDVAFDVDG